MYFKIINTHEQLYQNSNTLFFSNKSMKERFVNTFNVNKSFGNLTGFTDNIPIIVLDIAPDFNIKNQKLEEKYVIINTLFANFTEYPYFTYIYKDNNINKTNIVIEENENAINNIINTFKEIQFIIDNIYSNINDVIIIHLGKYAEYKYLFNMLFLNVYNKNIHSVYFKHPSYYLGKEPYITCKSFINDINKIKKILKESKND